MLLLLLLQLQLAGRLRNDEQCVIMCSKKTQTEAVSTMCCNVQHWRVWCRLSCTQVRRKSAGCSDDDARKQQRSHGRTRN